MLTFTGKNGLDRHFVRLRRAIVRRAAFDDVPNKHLFARVAHGLDDSRQELPCTSDKSDTLQVLVVARAFAHEEDIRTESALAGNGPRSGCVQGAGRTTGDPFSDRREAARRISRPRRGGG